MRGFMIRFGIGVVIISLFVVLAAFFLIDHDKKEIPVHVPIVTHTNETIEEKDLPILKKEENPVFVAIKNNDIDYCEYIDNQQEKEGCKQVVIDVRLKNQAVENFDSELCNDIVNENTRRACLELTNSGENFLREKSPDDLARYYMNNNNYDKAISIYEELIESNHSEGNYLALALTYAEKGLVEQEKGGSQIEYAKKAIDASDKAIKLNSTSSYAYRVRGYSYEILPSYNDALLSYNKAIELDSKNVLALTGRAHTYILIGDLEKAYNDFKEAIELDPENVYANMNLCTLERSLGKFDNAVKYCNVVINSKDSIDYLYKSQAYLIVGDIFLEMKNYTEAENNYLMAKSISPRDSNVKLSLVKLYNTKRELEKAEELVKEVIREVPTKAHAYELYAYNLYLQGRFDESIEVANKGIKLVDSDVSLIASLKKATEAQFYYIISSDYDQKGDLSNKEKYENMAEEVGN